MSLTAFSKTKSARSRIAALWMFACLVSASKAEPVLTRIADIRAISREDAAKFPAVHVRGVVIWERLAGWESFCVQDESAGIWVNMGLARSRKLWAREEAVLTSVREGVEVEIDGVLDPGGFSPNILPAKMRVLGRKMIPPARQVSLMRLLSGAEDCQRVEVTGVVHRCVASDGEWLLRLETGVGFVLARIPQGPDLTAEKLVDAELRVQGLVVSRFNWRSEHILPNLFVSRPEDVVILKPATTDAFEVPLVPSFALGRFSPEGRPLHRRRIEGIVTYFQPGSFCYLQNNSGCAIKVGTDSKEQLQPGDHVEAAGFISVARPVSELTEARVRKLGRGEQPKAVATDLSQIKKTFETALLEGLPARPHDFDGLLSSVEGRLISVQSDAVGGGQHLLMESEGSLVSAELSRSLTGEDAESLLALRPGSRLRVSGVAVLEYAGFFVEFASPTRLNLLLRGPEDVTVLAAASWWTSQRLSMAILGLGIVLLGSLAWTFSMRRLLQRRTQRLEEVMSAHRDAELEFASARRERLRLAADLHDGMKQLLTATSFRLDAAAGHLPHSPEAAANQLAAAHNSLTRTQTELEDSLRGLHAVTDGPPDLAQLFQHVIVSHDQWPQNAIILGSEGEPRPLPRDVAGSLLLMFQEAVNNALRHGHATRIEVMITHGVDALEIEVRDNGKGFDPSAVPGARDGHYGVEGMKQRMQWLRGRLLISRHHEGGMIVHAQLPWSEISEAPDKPVTEGECKTT